jgi:hypothetical protein
MMSARTMVHHFFAHASPASRPRKMNSSGYINRKRYP